MKGWIKLHRELLNKGIWINSTLEQRSILITLLCMANHKGQKWEWNGEIYNLKSGQFITSVQHIEERCNCKDITRQKIRTALIKFAKYGFLTAETTKKNTLITIVNWDFYQKSDDEDNQMVDKQMTNKSQTNDRQITNNQPTDNQQITNNQPTDNQQITTNKNDKNINNENNDMNDNNDNNDKKGKKGKAPFKDVVESDRVIHNREESDNSDNDFVDNIIDNDNMYVDDNVNKIDSMYVNDIDNINDNINYNDNVNDIDSNDNVINNKRSEDNMFVYNKNNNSLESEDTRIIDDMGISNYENTEEQSCDTPNNNQTNVINTFIDNNKFNRFEFESRLKKNVYFNSFYINNKGKEAEDIVELIMDLLVNNDDEVVVGGRTYQKQYLVNKIGNLDYEKMKYLIERYENLSQNADIKNPKKYMQGIIINVATNYNVEFKNLFESCFKNN